MNDLLDFRHYFTGHYRENHIVFMETMTITDYLRQPFNATPNPKLSPDIDPRTERTGKPDFTIPRSGTYKADVITGLKTVVLEKLKNIPFFQTPVGAKMLDKYVKFFTYQVIIDPSWKSLFQRQAGGNPYAIETAGGTVANMWRGWGDYFAAMGQRLANKINSTSYTPNVINQEVETWHADLAAKEGGLPSEKFTDALLLDNIGWKGWKWVSLDRGYCPEEAAAMGHCGNSGQKGGDNILSLRDPEGYAHLTFIVNSKMLGESKGRGNSKPSKRYHPAIKALLMSPLVNVIRGGGYDAPNNFHMEDMTKEDQEQIRKDKPHIDNFVDYLFNSDMSEKDLLAELYELLGYDFDKIIDKKQVVLDDEIEELKDLNAILEKFSGSKVDNIAWIDEFDSYDNYYGSGSISDLMQHVPNDIEEALHKHFEEKLKDEDDYEELMDMDLDDLISQYDDEVESAFHMADSDAHAVGTQDEAWKRIKSSLGEPTDNGFYVDFSTHPWKICIDLPYLKDVAKEVTENGYDFNELVDFKYSEPYNGYSDWDDKTFVERLREALSDIHIDVPPKAE